MERHRAPTAAAAGLVLCAMGLAFAGAPAAAQIADTTQTVVDSVVVTPAADPTIVPAEDTTSPPLSPTQAFIRSAIIPGWGQARFGSYVRGGVYFAGWVGNWFMLVKNQARLNDARDRYEQRLAYIREDLLAASPNPDSLAAAIDSFPSILVDAARADEGAGSTGNNLRKLVDARETQREDWIAWSIFWVLASGLDGFVTAHLSDFPAAIDIEQNADRSVSVGLQIPLRARRPR